MLEGEHREQSWNCGILSQIDLPICGVCLLLIQHLVYSQTNKQPAGKWHFSEWAHGQKLTQNAGEVWETIGSIDRVYLPARIMEGWDVKDLLRKNSCRDHPLLKTMEVTLPGVRDRVSCWGENWPRIHEEGSLIWNMSKTAANQTERKAASWQKSCQIAWKE